MIFTMDVGNTNIVIGCYEGDDLKFVSRITTNVAKMSDEYAVEIKSILDLYGCSLDSFEGAVLSSVVPPLTPSLRDAIRRLLDCEVLVINAAMNHGLDIKIPEPSILGNDLICASVGAIKKYSSPCIVIDLGTATKILAIGRDSSFLGCSILPGVMISLNALSSNTAQLPMINLESVTKVIGQTSIDSMKSGVVYGNAGMVDGMIDRYKSILGEDCSLVATGGIASSIIPHCTHKIILDHNLLLDGLLEIYKRNHN